MTPKQIEDLDPNIRLTVQWLNALNFHTTDSGDGSSKVEAIAEGNALAVPHVYIPISVDQMEREARRLHTQLKKAGVQVEQGDINSSYDPVSRSCILMLFNVDDNTLRAAGVKL